MHGQIQELPASTYPGVVEEVVETTVGLPGLLASLDAADSAAQDDHDAAALYDLLEHEIIPLFYERDASGLPTGWIGRIKASMQRLIPRFSAERMMREYVTALYGSGEPHP